MKTTIIIKGCMTRRQLAELYKMSEKQFKRRLDKHELNFGSDRILWPKQILEIVDAFGPWEITYDDA
ncbi:hypothetical protein GO730_21070 [Spirosoma sp. HMF3257]|uniref:Uncharacterized protein n=1 Tax=Spirosoma telluris TaxID=2183553 RepID=A0A327NKY7_9BACT|nr:hypothetical protein [Spirosoma telluris]RAI76040.1 hypothetical protein HMF3257_20995 [Spirosoma telluris]